MIDASAANYALALLAPLKENKDGGFMKVINQRTVTYFLIEDDSNKYRGEIEFYEVEGVSPEHAMAQRSLGEGEYLGTYELKQNIPEAILEAERHG